MIVKLYPSLLYGLQSTSVLFVCLCRTDRHTDTLLWGLSRNTLFQSYCYTALSMFLQHLLNLSVIMIQTFSQKILREEFTWET